MKLTFGSIIFVYISSLIFTIYWPVKLAVEGIPVGNVWVGFLFCIPWVFSSFMEWRKSTIHYPVAVAYSIFLSLLSLYSLEEYIYLRSFSQTLLGLISATIDDITYLALLTASGYLSYRAALRAAFTVKVLTKTIVTVMLVVIASLYVNGVLHAEAFTLHTAYMLFLASLFLSVGIFNAFSALLDYTSKTKNTPLSHCCV